MEENLVASLSFSIVSFCSVCRASRDASVLVIWYSKM